MKESIAIGIDSVMIGESVAERECFAFFFRFKTR